MAAPIDFYFEFASPYGYLASTQIDAIGARAWPRGRLAPDHAGRGVQGDRGEAADPDPAERALSAARRAALCPPARGAVHTSAGHAGQLAGREPRLHLAAGGRSGARPAPAQAVLHAHWGEGQDIGAPEQVAEIAAALGIGQGALLAAVADPAIKERLKRSTAAAIERGVFGSPFVFVDGEPFWGADRLPQVDAWLARGGW